jgi:hypothetical protein
MKKLTIAPNGGFICCVTPFIGQRCPDCQEFFANPQEVLGISAVAAHRKAKPRAKAEVTPPVELAVTEPTVPEDTPETTTPETDTAAETASADTAVVETVVIEEAPVQKPTKQSKQSKQSKQ